MEDDPFFPASYLQLFAFVPRAFLPRRKLCHSPPSWSRSAHHWESCALALCFPLLPAICRCLVSLVLAVVLCAPIAVLCCRILSWSGKRIYMLEPLSPLSFKNLTLALLVYLLYPFSSLPLSLHSHVVRGLYLLLLNPMPIHPLSPPFLPSSHFLFSSSCSVESSCGVF